MASKTIRVTQLKSTFGELKNIISSVKGLGLRRRHQTSRLSSAQSAAAPRTKGSPSSGKRATSRSTRAADEFASIKTFVYALAAWSVSGTASLEGALCGAGRKDCTPRSSSLGAASFGDRAPP